MASSVPPPASLATAIRDATWLAHRYDPDQDAFHFLPVSRNDRAAATFLTDELLPKGRQSVVVRRDDAVALRPTTAPIHHIFHSAYCCSTMLARAFDRPGWALALKEPVVLNDITGWRRRGGAGPDMAGVLADTLALLSRPFLHGEAVIAKPSTAANVLAPAMLALRADSRALLLHAPLPTYLASIAKKGLEGRLWVRTLLLGMIDDGLPMFGFGPRDHIGFTDLQVAAIGWLGQHAHFASIVARFGPERVRTLDSATFLARPRASMTALARLFGLAADDTTIDAILAGPAFHRHSKLGTRFQVQDRAAEHEEASARHADEIATVVTWGERVAELAGLSLVAPAPLIAR